MNGPTPKYSDTDISHKHDRTTCQDEQPVVCIKRKRHQLAETEPRSDRGGLESISSCSGRMVAVRTEPRFRLNVRFAGLAFRSRSHQIRFDVSVSFRGSQIKRGHSVFQFGVD